MFTVTSSTKSIVHSNVQYKAVLFVVTRNKLRIVLSYTQYNAVLLIVTSSTKQNYSQ